MPPSSTSIRAAVLLPDSPHSSPAPLDPRGVRSPAMAAFLELVGKVVDADSTLLVTGETGVGKEFLSRAIHAAGPRAEAPFVSVNCGALAESLLESELFGHVKGAFTGAAEARAGHFAAADGGTLFLDEIGELPLHLQVKLLTVLERRERVPVGSSEALPVDVRVIAATNRDLRCEVEAGRFREDLFYRLAVVPLAVPPLRERHEDLPELVERLLDRLRGELQRPELRGLTPEALAALLCHPWPGNVRELGNVLERAVLLCERERIDLCDLPPEVLAALDRDPAPAPAPVAAAPVPPTLPAATPTATPVANAVVHAAAPTPDLPANWRELSLRDVRQRAADLAERQYLEAVLTDVGGVAKVAAARCGLAPRSFYDRLRHHGLRRADYSLPRRPPQ
jgi:transcriptional regulator with GAF, ATPase, and Fis domain